MPSFRREDIAKLAQLAHLDVTDEELTSLRSDLEGIVAYVDRLEQVDVSGLEPMQHPFDAQNVWREDVVEPSLPQEVALANAPRRVESFFEFPRIVPGKKTESNRNDDEDIE